MKKISVQLDRIATEALNEILLINRCSISDAVNAALLAFSKDRQPSMILPEDPMDLLVGMITDKYGSLQEYCGYRDINISRLRYLVRRTAKGHNVCGFGNTKNKWRDKQDGRIYKTHTAWIAHCLKEDFDIDL